MQQKQETREIKRISRYGDEPQRRTKWLRVDGSKRTTHPLLDRRTMICKRIEQITRTDHETYRVLLQRAIDDIDYVALDCRTILDISPNPDDKDTIKFMFEEYCTDAERAALHEQYLRGEYDDFDDVPEY
jgi:hypothetical protein